MRRTSVKGRVQLLEPDLTLIDRSTAEKSGRALEPSEYFSNCMNFVDVLVHALTDLVD
jgi:hypothetical protein